MRGMENGRIEEFSGEYVDVVKTRDPSHNTTLILIISIDNI